MFYTIKSKPFIKDLLKIQSWFYQQTAQGLYLLTPLGQVILDQIINVINKEMKMIFNKITAPVLQKSELIDNSDRDQKIQNILLKIDQLNLYLSPTCEEVFENLWKDNCIKDKSLNDKSLALYQIQSKFRKEQRYNSGMYRTMEFLMKDAYAFGTKDYVNNIFNKTLNAYKNIFDFLGLSYTLYDNKAVEEMGNINSFSTEFQVNGSEIAELFYLDKTYTKNTDFVAGSYGIGVTRVLEIVIQQLVNNTNSKVQYFHHIDSPVTVKSQDNLTLKNIKNPVIIDLESTNKKFILGVAKILNITNVEFL